MRYFHALVNGLAISAFRLRVRAGPVRLSPGWAPVHACFRYPPTYPLCADHHTPARVSDAAVPREPPQATAIDAGCGMTTRVEKSMFAAPTAATGLGASCSC